MTIEKSNKCNPLVDKINEALETIWQLTILKEELRDSPDFTTTPNISITSCNKQYLFCLPQQVLIDIAKLIETNLNNYHEKLESKLAEI